MLKFSSSSSFFCWKWFGLRNLRKKNSFGPWIGFQIEFVYSFKASYFSVRSETLHKIKIETLKKYIKFDFFLMFMLYGDFKTAKLNKNKKMIRFFLYLNNKHNFEDKCLDSIWRNLWLFWLNFFAMKLVPQSFILKTE